MRRQVMHEREWSRSRFWLCHFLYSRHERPAIAWDGLSEAHPKIQNKKTKFDHAAADWLDWQIQINESSRHRLIHWATTQCADDPAYIQSLRLFVREEQHHQTIARRWLSQAGHATVSGAGVRTAIRVALRPLGLRFELSLLLLSEIATLTLNRLLHARATDPALRGVLGQIIADHEQHIAFHSERLTAEFADFNFIRRNLRRLRLRGMHTTLLRGIAWRHRSLLKSIDLSPAAFRRAANANFETVLSTMVPYRRETLLAALLQQSENRYEKPTRV